MCLLECTKHILFYRTCGIATVKKIPLPLTFSKIIENYLQISKTFCIFAPERKNLMTDMMNDTVMLAERQTTISSRKWNSLHTIDELDATLKSIIHYHFHGNKA